MWAPLAVVLMILATALGARGAGVEATDATELEIDAAPAVLELAASHAEPVEASLLFSSPARGNGVFPVVPPEMGMSLNGRTFGDELLESIELSDAIGEPRLPGVFGEIPGLGVRAERDFLPGVAGNPQLLSSFAGRELFSDGRLSLEAGVQLPLFDDRPGLPEPEFIVQFRLQF